MWSYITQIPESMCLSLYAYSYVENLAFRYNPFDV